MRFYVVANKPNVSKAIVSGNIDDIIIYTIVRKLKHCTEYVNKYLKIKNFTHFLNWCDAHSMNPEDKYAWSKYSSVVVKDQFKDFYISIFNFNSQILAAFLRLLNGCIPVGASYELPSEISTFLQKNCDEEGIKELMESLGEEEVESSLKQL